MRSIYKKKKKSNKKKISLISHISSRGTGSTFDISRHGRRVSPCKTFSISETTVCNVHCKKNNYFLSVYCILRLSLSTPVLNFPSRFLKLFKICNMLDRPGSSGFLCFIIYNLVGLWVYIWRRNEPPWCPVLLVREMGWTATQSVWCWSEPVVTNHCCNLDSSETFVICSTFSVFNIKFFQSVFEYPRKSASLLSSAVIWCFLYIRHEFDTAIVATFIRKRFSKIFPYLFVRRRRKNYNNTTFAFSMIAFFFQCCGIFNFGYCQVSCVTLSSRAFFNICKWSKNACPTFLKKICILRIWM